MVAAAGVLYFLLGVFLSMLDAKRLHILSKEFALEFAGSDNFLYRRKSYMMWLSAGHIFCFGVSSTIWPYLVWSRVRL